MATRYVAFKLEAFNNLMESIGFKPVDIEGTEEYTYERQIESKSGIKLPFNVRVYSTVDKRTNVTRDKDSDAIRLLLINTETGKPVRLERRVFRTKSAFTNTIERARELFKYAFNNSCPACKKGVMVERKSKQGPFKGCTNYPNCRYTKEVS